MEFNDRNRKCYRGSRSPKQHANQRRPINSRSSWRVNYTREQGEEFIRLPGHFNNIHRIPGPVSQANHRPLMMGTRSPRESHRIYGDTLAYKAISRSVSLLLIQLNSAPSPPVYLRLTVRPRIEAAWEVFYFGVYFGKETTRKCKYFPRDIFMTLLSSSVARPGRPVTDFHGQSHEPVTGDEFLTTTSSREPPPPPPWKAVSEAFLANLLAR